MFILGMLTLRFVPTYEYECVKCPRTFEVRQRITEPALATCEICGGPIRRLLAAAPFILKGGGWYVTDYPSEARKKAQSGESPAKPPAAAETKAGSGTESSKGGTGASSGSGSSDGSTASTSKDSPAKSSGSS
jgi:putative FmdB family regulatory protein